MGNLVSFFPARKAENLSQESNTSSNRLQPVLFKYRLKEEQLPPEVEGYKNAVELVTDLAAINRFSGEKKRVIDVAKALSLYLFEKLGDHFSETEEIFYISQTYYDVFGELLQQNQCLYPNLFLSYEKTNRAITALLAVIPEQKELPWLNIPTSDHSFEMRC
jgi:hypothetical protein